MSYQPEIPLNPELNPTHEQIERRAYEIYIARGGEVGHDLADWITAEEELTAIAKIVAATPKPLGHAAKQSEPSRHAQPAQLEEPSLGRKR